MAVDLFNEQWYLDQNPDVAAAVAAGLTTAYQHFMAYGQYESRAPSALFDPTFYLDQNPDVAAAVAAGLASAYEHFLLYGQSEPRTISPFIDLAAYANANPDLAAVEGLNLYQHLVTYGLHENRDLGNGITLGQFANDPVFNAALADPDHILEALARIAEVAPFLPDFQPPEGWTPPADTPIPTDFVPPEGLLLVVPPSVTVPEGTELPDTFKPVDSGSGGTGGTGGSGGGGGGDTVAPVFQSAAINTDGSKLIMTYDGALSGTTAATTAFTVKVDDADNAVTAVTIDGSTVQLTLTTPVSKGQAVTVAYDDPSTGNDSHAIQDAAGNDAATLAATAVTNGTTYIHVAAGGDIKAAIAAAADGDTIYLAKGTHNIPEEISITKAISIVGADDDTSDTAQDVVINTAAGVRAFVVNGTVTGTVSITGIQVTGGSEAVTIDGSTLPLQANVGSLVVTNSTFISQTNGGLVIGLNHKDSSLGNLFIDKVIFDQSATGLSQNTDASHAAGIMMFGFDGGKASISNVTIKGLADKGTTNASPWYGIQIQGAQNSELGGGVWVNGPELNNAENSAIALNNVTLEGGFSKNAVAVFNYENIDHLSITDMAFTDSASGWGTGLNVDGIMDNYDASAWTFSAGAKIALQGNATAHTVTGSTITGTDFDDTIVGKTGMDTLIGGAGQNTFVFSNTSTGIPSNTNFDTIEDWIAGMNNIIDFGATALVINGGGSSAAAGQASISSTGVATFHANDDTLAEQLAAVEAAISAIGSGTPTAGGVAIWQNGDDGDAYLFISDATAGLTATDVLIKLTGVYLNPDDGLTITAGDITGIAMAL